MAEELEKLVAEAEEHADVTESFLTEACER